MAAMARSLGTVKLSVMCVMLVQAAAPPVDRGALHILRCFCDFCADHEYAGDKGPERRQVQEDAGWLGVRGQHTEQRSEHALSNQKSSQMFECNVTFPIPAHDGISSHQQVSCLKSIWHAQNDQPCIRPAAEQAALVAF